MKKIIAVVICLLILATYTANLTFAQGIEIECDEEVIIRNGIDIQFPTVDVGAVHTVTALGIADYDPVIAVFNQGQNGGCNDDSDEAAGYEVDLPTTGWVVPNTFNSQMLFSNSSFMRIVAGEFEDLSGEAVIMVEGLTYDGTPDLVNVTVTGDMARSGIPLTAYVLEQTLNLDLSIALVDDNGVPLQDDNEQPIACDDAGDNELCWGSHSPLLESYTNISNTIFTEGTALSPMLSVPLTADSAETIVPFQIQQSAEAEENLTGDYILLLHYGVGEIDIADGLATALSDEVGTSISCDEELIVSDAIEVTIPRVDAPYTVSLIAKTIENPVLANMNSAGGGTCHQSSPLGESIFATLPIIEDFNRSTNNVYTNAFGENARLLTGLADDTSGDYLMVIDNLSIAPDGTSDIVSVTVTESMITSEQPVSVFMISKSLDFNAQLTLVGADQEVLIDGNGLPIQCNHTLDADACWGDYADMTAAQVTLGEDVTFGASQDVMLSIPLTPDFVGTSLNFMSSGVDGSFGDYLLVLHFATTNPDDS